MFCAIVVLLCWVSEFLQSLMIFMLYYCEREAISEANIKWQLHSIQKCCCFYSSWIYLLKMSIIHARRHHNHYHIRLTAAIAASHVFSLNNNCIAWLMRQNSFHFLDLELQHLILLHKWNLYKGRKIKYCCWIWFNKKLRY